MLTARNVILPVYPSFLTGPGQLRQGKFVLGTEKNRFTVANAEDAEEEHEGFSLRVLCGEKGFVFMGCRHEPSSVALRLPGIHEYFPSWILTMNF